MEFKAYSYSIPEKMKLLYEYNYYLEADDDPTDDDTKLDGDEDMQSDDDIDLNAPELNGDEDNADLDAEITGDDTGDAEMDNPDEDEPDTEQFDDTNEVEIDVTDIINKQEEILSKYNEVISSINGLKASYGSALKDIKQHVTDVSTKIDSTGESIKQELRKRIPTPNEKLELRSMSSFPYSNKLSDYWKPAGHEDEYEFSIHNNKNSGENYLDKVNKNNEYLLKQSDVNNGYNEYDIERSI